MHVLALALTLAGCAPKADTDAKFAALEERIAKLESGAKASAPASSAEEEAATKLMNEIQEARKGGDYATAKAKLAELTGKYASTRAGKVAGRMAAEINLVGSDAKPVEAASWYTKQASLSDAPTTVLVFWEEWCPHCKREVPKLPEMQAKFKDKGVQVIALTKVTKSSTDEKVQAFIKENKLEGIPMGKEAEGAMSNAYAVTGIPAAAVVKDGKVVWRGHPAQLTDEVLTKLAAG
jgi:thiol-disulfide isomerase/thioredoxin